MCVTLRRPVPCEGKRWRDQGWMGGWVDGWVGGWVGGWMWMIWFFILSECFTEQVFFLHRRFGTKCAGCSQGISPNDLVRRARSKVFHLNCFTCMMCNKQLSTGEELYIIDENKFVCKEDYLNNASVKDASLLSGTDCIAFLSLHSSIADILINVVFSTQHCVFHTTNDSDVCGVILQSRWTTFCVSK